MVRRGGGYCPSYASLNAEGEGAKMGGMHDKRRGPKGVATNLFAPLRWEGAH
jgi:hypothetical protein